MNVNALRTWGIAASAALMVGALAFAAQGAPEATAQVTAPQAVFEIAQAPGTQSAAPVGFIVRFQGTGPIAQAQGIAARGRTAQAQRQVEAQLRRQSAFSGLCFDRFTVGGAEIVLRSCQNIAGAERASYQQRWVARLQAMRAVDYVDPNATVTQNRAPG